MAVQIFFDCTEREDGPLRSTDQGASLAVLVHDYDEQGDASVELVSRVDLGASVEPEWTVGPIDRGIRRPRIAARQSFPLCHH